MIRQLTKAGFHREAASTAPDWAGLVSGRAVKVMARGLFPLTQSPLGLAAQCKQPSERGAALRSLAIAVAEFSPKLMWGTDCYANNFCLPWRVPGT